MRTRNFIPLLFAVLCAAGSGQQPPSTSQSLTPERAAAIDKDVRAFLATVAHDVTAEGPAAWRKHFADDPAFFMAAEGQLVFPNSASATAGIEQLKRAIKHIELQWGDDLRVDPLTPELAAVATSYHEIRVSSAGNKVDETGFFTAITECRNGSWQFRNAHWSLAGPLRAVR